MPQDDAAPASVPVPEPQTTVTLDGKTTSPEQAAELNNNFEAFFHELDARDAAAAKEAETEVKAKPLSDAERTPEPEEWKPSDKADKPEGKRARRTAEGDLTTRPSDRPPEVPEPDQPPQPEPQREKKRVERISDDELDAMRHDQAGSFAKIKGNLKDARVENKAVTQENKALRAILAPLTEAGIDIDTLTPESFREQLKAAEPAHALAQLEQDDVDALRKWQDLDHSYAVDNDTSFANQWRNPALQAFYEFVDDVKRYFPVPPAEQEKWAAPLKDPNLNDPMDVKYVPEKWFVDMIEGATNADHGAKQRLIARATVAFERRKGYLFERARRINPQSYLDWTKQREVADRQEYETRVRARYEDFLLKTPAGQEFAAWKNNPAKEAEAASIIQLATASPENMTDLVFSFLVQRARLDFANMIVPKIVQENADGKAEREKLRKDLTTKRRVSDTALSNGHGASAKSTSESTKLPTNSRASLKEAFDKHLPSV